MRSEIDVINRLRYDPDMDADDYVLGWEDRFLGILESSLSELDPEVPLHRVRYFKRVSDGQIVWDRRTKLDLLFKPKQKSQLFQQLEEEDKAEMEAKRKRSEQRCEQRRRARDILAKPYPSPGSA